MLSELKESKKDVNPIDLKNNKDEKELAKEELIFNIQTLVAEGKYKEADKIIKLSLSKNYNDPQMLSLSALGCCCDARLGPSNSKIACGH